MSEVPVAPVISADDLWNAGRTRVLADFLERPRLFLTDRFHERLDGRSRANLAFEIDRLTGP